MMRRMAAWGILGFIVFWSSLGLTAEWRIGIARTDVTPTKMLWMSGYAARKHPAEGTVHPLWAKALVIEDRRGERAVIVTTDLIGDEFGRELPDTVGSCVYRQTGIKRERIVFNASHTHSGPVVRVSDGARVTYGMNAQQREDVNAYGQILQNKLVKLIEDACATMRPAALAFGEGKADFGMNRRKRYNPHGPVDPTVSALRVTAENGELLVAMFGYACHATTLGGKLYLYNGDYPGFAQIAFERAHPGATAMFVAGCGGDINPDPRGTLELAEQHGKSLADAVEKALTGDLHPVRGPLTVAFQRVDLPLVDPPTNDELLGRRGKGDIYDQRLTEVLLKRIAKKGSLETSFSWPVQVIKFGKDLSLVALGGEVCVDFALRLRKELAPQRIWVAGYSNEVLAYIPSERVLAEGGYEAGGAMRYFGWHGPFKPGVEDRVIGAVKKLMER